jgi:hypothetical protein
MHPYCIVCCVFTISSPSFSPIDPETAADAAEYDYIVDKQTPSAELPGKQNPLDHLDIAYPSSLMLALELLLLLFR